MGGLRGGFQPSTGPQHSISCHTVPVESFPVLGYNGSPSVGLGVRRGHTEQRVGAPKDAARGLRPPQAVVSSDGKSSMLSSRHVVKPTSFCSQKQTRRRHGQCYQWAASHPRWGDVKEHHQARLCPHPRCWVWLQELSHPGDGHDPHGNAKCHIRFLLQEFNAGFEGGDTKQSFGIALARVMLRGGI